MHFRCFWTATQLNCARSNWLFMQPTRSIKSVQQLNSVCPMKQFRNTLFSSHFKLSAIFSLIFFRLLHGDLFRHLHASSEWKLNASLDLFFEAFSSLDSNSKMNTTTRVFFGTLEFQISIEKSFLCLIEGRTVTSRIRQRERMLQFSPKMREGGKKNTSKIHINYSTGTFIRWKRESSIRCQIKLFNSFSLWWGSLKFTYTWGRQSFSLFDNIFMQGGGGGSSNFNNSGKTEIMSWIISVDWVIKVDSNIPSLPLQHQRDVCVMYRKPRLNMRD